MKKNDIIAVLILGEIASWLGLAVLRGFLKPELYAKFSGTLTIGLPIIFPLACLVFIYLTLKIGQKISVVAEAGKFVLIGGFNTLADWGILSFLIFFSKKSLNLNTNDIMFEILSVSIVYYSLFKAISFVIATTNSYFWNKFWTFRRKTTEKAGKEFLQFITVSIFGFLINVGIASMVFKFIAPFGGLSLDQWGIVCAAIATVISMVWNFLGYKFIVFEKRNEQQPGNLS